MARSVGVSGRPATSAASMASRPSMASGNALSLSIVLIAYTASVNSTSSPPMG